MTDTSCLNTDWIHDCDSVASLAMDADLRQRALGSGLGLHDLSIHCLFYDISSNSLHLIVKVCCNMSLLVQSGPH